MKKKKKSCQKFCQKETERSINHKLNYFLSYLFLFSWLSFAKVQLFQKENIEVTKISMYCMIKIRLINFFQFLALQQVARVKLVKRTFEKKWNGENKSEVLHFLQNHISLSKLDCILEKSFHLQCSFRALQNSSKEVVQTCTARLEFVFSSVLISMTTIMEHSSTQLCEKMLIVPAVTWSWTKFDFQN